MDGARMQALIYGGYAKTAQRLGLAFDLYRPNGASNPLDAANKRAPLTAHFRVDDKLLKWSDYGNPLYSVWADGTQLQVGDYLVGSDTYFIAGMQSLLPILAVQCTRTLDIASPTATGTTTPKMTGWPASVLKGSAKGGRDEAQYPGTVASPWWEMLLPAAPGVALGVADLITDELGRLYFVETAELTGYGWRLLAEQTSLLTDSAVYHFATVIERIGKSVTLRKVTHGTGPNPAISTTDYSVKALITAYDTRLIDGTTITVRDQKVMIGTAATDGTVLPVPTSLDQLVIDGAVHTIGIVTTEYAGSVAAVYQIQAKG